MLRIIACETWNLVARPEIPIEIYTNVMNLIGKSQVSCGILPFALQEIYQLKLDLLVWARRSVACLAAVAKYELDIVFLSLFFFLWPTEKDGRLRDRSNTSWTHLKETRAHWPLRTSNREMEALTLVGPVTRLEAKRAKSSSKCLVST